MEQYYLPKLLDFEHLRFCLDNYIPEQIFIRLMGSMGGTEKVNEILEDKILNFRTDTKKIYFSIDDQDVIEFSLKNYLQSDFSFTLAYERIENTSKGERYLFLSHGKDPYDSSLLEPKKSILRHSMDWHLIEISFKGRINLEQLPEQKSASFP